METFTIDLNNTPTPIVVHSEDLSEKLKQANHTIVRQKLKISELETTIENIRFEVQQFIEGIGEDIDITN